MESADRKIKSCAIIENLLRLVCAVRPGTNLPCGLSSEIAFLQGFSPTNMQLTGNDTLSTEGSKDWLKFNGTDYIF